MSDDYRQMWKELGLDLDAHDALLGVLGQAYQDIYLAQKQRPEGMGYFDFVMSEVHGLRIKELVDEKAAGRKIVGSYCVFVPEEIVLAANATLVGLCSGADFATEDVEKLLPRNTCALIKSSFGFKLGKVCPYLESADMIVGENTCDGKKKAYESLAGLVDNLYVMDLPQVKSENGKALLKAEFLRFKAAVEKLTGVTITAERLKEAIQTVNAKRAALHRLSTLRKADPACPLGSQRFDDADESGAAPVFFEEELAPLVRSAPDGAAQHRLLGHPYEIQGPMDFDFRQMLEPQEPRQLEGLVLPQKLVERRHEAPRDEKGLAHPGVQRLAATHCTGAKAERILKDEFEDDFLTGGAGAVFEL